MTHGEAVSTFEREFAAYVGARYAIAMTNGTVTLEVALRAMGVGAGDKVATTPLTMAATSMAILNVGAVPVYHDVDPRTWLMNLNYEKETRVLLPVSLYGLHMPWCGSADIDDAAQTLRPHRRAAFTSYSFQRSKILNTGEGGMLVTDSEELATLARSIGSLGYDLHPAQSRIDKTAIKSPNAVRHVRYGVNARMNDVTATRGLQQLYMADHLRAERVRCAEMYRQAIAGCAWLTPQHVPEGSQHDYWCYTVAYGGRRHVHPLIYAIEQFGGEVPYGAWRLAYQEPAFRHLAPDGTCPVAESLQPRLLQFQTNDFVSADWNATALHRAIREIGG